MSFLSVTERERKIDRLRETETDRDRETEKQTDRQAEKTELFIEGASSPLQMR